MRPGEHQVANGVERCGGILGAARVRTEEALIALLFTEHAIDRMLDWDVDADDVAGVLATGETIEEYDDGSRLVLGRRGVRPLHVVAADPEEETTVVITVYEPSAVRWDAGFRVRRPR